MHVRGPGPVAPVRNGGRAAARLPFLFSVPTIKWICILAVAALLPASALSASGRSHLSSDPRVNDARALIENSRFSEALAVLRPLTPDREDRTDVLFLVGLAAIGASQQAGAGEGERIALLDEAIAALRAILIDRPGLVRVRLELARAFFLKSEDDLAREHFERVLAGGPPPAMAANIRRFLEAIRARRLWSGYFGAVIAPDSNVNAASESEVIHIRGLPFRRDADAGARPGVGVILWGGGEYQHPLHRELRLRAGVDLSRREYAGRDFDQTFLSGHVGPRWLADRDTEASLLASVRRRWTAGKPESRGLGARFESEHRFSRRLTASLRAAWHRHEYRGDGSLDGPQDALSLGVAWLLTSTAQIDAMIGHARERPESMHRRNATRWARMGLSMALPGVTLRGSAELRRTRFKGDWFPFTSAGASRADRTRILRVSIFNRAFTVRGVSPQLVLTNEVRQSNAQLHDYRRNRAELQFVRQF